MRRWLVIGLVLLITLAFAVYFITETIRLTRHAIAHHQWWWLSVDLALLLLVAWVSLIPLRRHRRGKPLSDHLSSYGRHP